jgi:epoxyqueuosine reductase
MLSAAAVKEAARNAGFALCGLARAEALDPGPLQRWLAAGHAADMAWMGAHPEQRLDPRQVLPGALTVIALGIPYGDPRGPDGERSGVARYARGRDYHYAHRDRLKVLRKRLLALDPRVETYACVDTGLAMEKPWAQRAGLGFIGKNGCLITMSHGSWVTLSVMFMDRAVDRHDQEQAQLCGDCTRCLQACPTDAFPAPGVVDARRCLSYQTIENQGLVPLPLRPRVTGHVFGCDVCQEVCPFNHGELPVGDARFAARPLGLLPPEQIAALDREQFDRLAPGMALARPGYDGLRRNAILALGKVRGQRVRPLLARLADDPSPIVKDAARWLLEQLDQRDPLD